MKSAKSLHKYADTALRETGVNGQLTDGRTA